MHAEGPGGRVHGLVREPLGRSRPHAAVFVIHGGPGWHLQDEWNDALPALGDVGYAVVTVDYRGSVGQGATWRDALHRDAGAIECEDIAAIVDRLVADGVVDPDHLAISGTSWGGFIALNALGRQPGRWRAGIAHVPLADWELAWELEPEPFRAFDAALIGGRFEEIPEVYRAASPITYVDHVVAPLLITGGESDPRCPIEQIDSYVERLVARGHDVRYQLRATGHLAFDLDETVTETEQMLEFLAETCPVVDSI